MCKARKIITMGICCVLFASLVFAEDLQELPFTAGTQPPVAEEGYAWCLVTIPPTFKTVTKEVVVSPAVSYYEPISPEYETVTESVETVPAKQIGVYVPAEWKTEIVRQLVEEAHTEYRIIPPQYEWVEEDLEVVPGHDDVEYTPAEYAKQTKEIEIAPERSLANKVICKKGYVCYAQVRCPAQTENLMIDVMKNDGSVNKIPVEPKMRTVRIHKLVKDTSVEEIQIEAKYVDVEVNVLVKPAAYRFEDTEPIFKTVEYLAISKPAGQQKVDLPEQVETLVSTELDQPATRVWRKMDLRECDMPKHLTKKYGCIPGAGH